MDKDVRSPNAGPLIAALKQALRGQGLTYAQVAQRMRLSEASIKRLLSRGRLSLGQLLQLADIAGVDLADLAHRARSARPMPDRLTIEQERALADDPRLLMLFHLLMAGHGVEEIAREYGLQGTERTLLLARLDRLGLIDLLPSDRVRLRIARGFAWRSNGPLRRRYGPRILREFIADRFDGERSLLRFEVRELSEASIELIHRKLERLAVEITEMAELDSNLPGERRRSFGVALAARPWVFSVAAAMRAKGDGKADAAASRPRARR